MKTIMRGDYVLAQPTDNLASVVAVVKVV
ncbi:hypothetical protein OH492_22110 [Vibrio chagasii]|nr:hypothetical protein [Vibrio chagasii]